MQGWEKEAGVVLMIGLPAPNLDEATARALHDLHPGGVILFGRNLETPARLERLLEDVRPFLAASPLFAIDQEGGRVSRLRPWIGPTPAAHALALAGSESVRRFGAATGAALGALGVNLDFAPVVDLCAPGVANGIGDRSFGTDPHAVADLAEAFLDGLQASGVAGCLKHFPGLGDTTVDSHEELPICRSPAARLDTRDLVPYRRCRSAEAVMVSHAAYPALDADPLRPASLSPDVVGAWLRERLAFGGLVVSDDLEMRAVAPLDSGGAAAVAAVGAGCDLILYCRDLDRAAAARDALAREAAASPAFARRLESAADGVARFAERWPARAPDLGAWEIARAEVAEVNTG